jgi:hypothetical protein
MSRAIPQWFKPPSCSRCCNVSLGHCSPRGRSISCAEALVQYSPLHVLNGGSFLRKAQLQSLQGPRPDSAPQFHPKTCTRRCAPRGSRPPCCPPRLWQWRAFSRGAGFPKRKSATWTKTSHFHWIFAARIRPECGCFSGVTYSPCTSFRRPHRVQKHQCTHLLRCTSSATSCSASR